MICVPIIAGNTREAIPKIVRAGREADWIELRLDRMKTFSLNEMVARSNRPVLVTYRSVGE
jgi:3-dehydroquinate dehydratase